MKEYYFFFNDNNEFLCEITESNEQVELTEQEAIDKLINIDNINFSKVRASNRLIILKGSDTSVIISDLNDFYSYGYSEYIPSIMKRVNKAIAKNQKAKHHNEKIKNMKVVGGRIACGALILTILGTTAGTIRKNLSDNNNNNNNFNIENEYNDMPIKMEPIPAEICEDDYNQMINELDEVSESNVEVTPSNNIIEENPIDTAYLRFEDSTSSITYKGAYEGYHDIVEKYSTKWGISPNIIMAILTQESAGKQVNLMQIEFDAWRDQRLTAYDFVNHRYQTIVLTDKPQDYVGKNITVITREDLKNKKTNISVACVILRYCLEQMDYNILVSIQAYNLGCENMNDVLEETSRQTGISVDELLSDPTNVEFINYTYVPDCGDPEYLNNVFRYLTDGEITIKVLNENKEVEDLVINIAQKKL